jgi:hypothetical protein
MATGHWPPGSDAVARQLAQSLDAAADLLDAASDAEAFLKALETNGITWRELARTAEALGWTVPQRMVELSTRAVARAQRGINDGEVESLIRMNRSMSRDMNALAANGEASSTPHWHDWMERRLCAKA